MRTLNIPILNKVYIVLVLILVSTNLILSQSWQVVQSSPSVMLNDLCFLQNGLTGWAVGSTSAQSNYLNALYKTTNGGSNWEFIQFPNTTLLQGVFFADASTGWVTGTGGAVYKSTDGGINWIAQNSGTGRILYKAQFINSNTGWIVGGRQDGSDYLLLKTTNGGTNWENLSFGSGAYSNEGVYFLNDMTGWVCGSDNTIAGAIHKTTDGGLTWNRKNIPVTTTIVTTIKFANTNKGWASSSSIYNTGPIYYSSDGGENWSVQTNTNQHYHYLDVKDSMNAAVVGSRVLSPAGTHVFVTSNGGTTWIDNNTPISNYTNSVKYIGNSIWIAADYSQILQSTNSGTNWIFQFRSARLRSVVWTASLTGWITGNTVLGSTGITLKTVNGGLNWIADLNSPGGAQISFVNPDYGWVLWEGNSAYIWRTTNGGGTWSQNFIPAGGWTGGIFFINKDTGWAFGSSGNLRFTADGGVSWVPQNPASSNYIQSVFFVNSNEGWLGGGYSSGNGFISHTTNTGQTWTPQIPATGAHVLDLFFLNKNYGWATMLSGGVQRTTNGGQNWILAGSVSKDYAERILMINQDTGWVVAYNLASGSGDGLGYIYKTYDGGSTLIQEYVTSWPRSDLTDIAIRDNKLWVTGNHNTILSYDIPIGIKPINSSVPEKFKLFQNYPNPFNPVTKIKFDIPSNVKSEKSNVNIIIYDILGKEIEVLVNQQLQPGSYEVGWDGNNYTSGVYFYKITSGDYSNSKKMVLVK